jgi:hypothetical protein
VYKREVHLVRRSLRCALWWGAHTLRLEALLDQGILGQLVLYGRH